MRTEEQVLYQILDFAQADDRVRAVMLNGSRVNPDAPVDIMRDYDVVFFVTDVENDSYKRERKWIKDFGELVILQQNNFANGYIIMMQFKDGIRIDLSFADIKEFKQAVTEDSLTVILLDKDGLVKSIPAANDSTYHVKRPAQEEFEKILNESWWIQVYIAKEIWRDELPLAKYMFDVISLDCIRKLLAWHLGNEHDWKINVGKCGKWFKRLLPEDLYQEFISIYPTTDYDDIWLSLSKAGKIIRRLGTKLSNQLGYRYPMDDDINVTAFIKKIKGLPADATDM